MVSSFEPNLNLINRGQGLKGLGLCLLLAALPASALLKFNPLVAGILLLLGALPGILLFLKGRSLYNEGCDGLIEGEFAPPQSPLLQILRILASFVATGFILLTALGLLGTVLASTFGNSNSPAQAPLGAKESAPWYLFVTLPLYLLAWLWALYLTFPRFQSLGARIGLGVLLAIFIPGAFLVVGIGGAIAIPALNQAKKDAQLHIGQELVGAADQQVQAFEAQNGRPPSNWKELSLLINGKPIEGPQDCAARLPQGSRIEIRGIDGATSTRILLPNGSSITPKGKLQLDGDSPAHSTPPIPTTSSPSLPQTPDSQGGGELIIREINHRLALPPGWKGVRLDNTQHPGGESIYQIKSPQGDGELALVLTQKDPRLIPRGDILVKLLSQSNLTSQFDKSQIVSVKPPAVTANGKAASMTIVVNEAGKPREAVFFAFVVDNRLILLSRASSTPEAKTHLQTMIRSIKM